MSSPARDPAIDRDLAAPLSFLDEGLADLEARGLLRALRPVEGEQGPEIVVNGERVLCCCSNNYLGLAADPRLRGAASEASLALGTGSGASRLISGDGTLAHALEDALARLKRTEAALLFNSGFHANLGALPALVGPGDLLLSDELNHASLIDGARLARAETRVYRHADVADLEAKLSDAETFRRRLIVTDSVFSMDGTIAPVDAILALAERHDALLYVDEAHATGVVGEGGRGVVEHFGLASPRIVQMGTLGKALGSFGAFVAGSRTLVDWLTNRARTFVYTTGLPPAVLAASLAAVEIVEREPERRHRLRALTGRMRDGLVAAGFRIGGEPGIPIVPVHVGEPGPTMELSRALLARGVLASGIRPPTVPAGTSRIRVTLMASMTDAHVDRALGAFAEAGREAGIVS